MTVIIPIRVLKQGVFGQHRPFYSPIQTLIIGSFGRCNWQGHCRARLYECVFKCVCESTKAWSGSWRVNQRRPSGTVPGREILSAVPWPRVVLKYLFRMCVFCVCVSVHASLYVWNKGGLTNVVWRYESVSVLVDYFMKGSWVEQGRGVCVTVICIYAH